MNYVSAENLTKSYGIKVLFKNISFHINEGDKIAIVAKNGSGKSTLLKILMGKEIADSGTAIINKDIQVVLFDQEIDFDPDLNIEEFMMTLDSAPILALKNYHKSLHSTDNDFIEKALADMEAHKAWDLENEMKQILSQLKITDLEAKMGTLSGGQIKRVALAKLLTETRAEHRHTLLIMDEPTNHLDVNMVEWLENYLNKAKITLLLVTHDRYFLDSVCDIIWEMEDGNLYTHNGSYATYLENKMIREDNLNATIDKANNLYRKELEWMRRQPKARTTKSKSRIDSFYETEKIAKTDTRKDGLELDFEMKRLGNKILELKHIDKSFGSKVLLKDFSYQFQRGEKVGIVGKNGAGKSTLLNIIQGFEKADRGEIETGETISFGYFSQKGLTYKEDERVIDFIKEIAEFYPLANGKSLSASQFLRLFLFDDQTQYNPISKLSGGEKRRLHLMYILYQNPNFLIFDEPTNDLDLPTLTVLENFLQQFQGSLIIVSHDRYFMDRIVDHVLAFEGEGKIRDFVGNFSEYREARSREEALEKNSATKPEPVKEAASNPQNISSLPSKKKKLTFKEQKELETIEKEMPELEVQRADILEMLNNETDYEKIAKLSSELETVSEKLENHEMRWLELQEEI
ncbi:ABC-F family ATP-binding cassette domain-containing protein [Chryseobacterium indologenes]|uniref:ABC-F family ATP-binding cassette domain-containing protein n=1 Tax=Chryseobacterium indologenes TaxID=253 RepID=UPI0003E08048|nr:ABC-F family ATP-binding cassette domain-containing protein [Chryseobacterium indologenes]ASE62682.1 ABC transporter ATP-binding protein [Chryseobacterium indologenes]ATN06500.1 ABC transporter ATP-binding protein [Chryseobacterium indologenes]AYY84739.1 ABC transporter ATP-binding protein [Chryseobacterium indologenes]MBF6642972.1 ABC-F family ATP-binding cassette domain-containing protein [Chryseobacterium indologenes]MBU3049195.1 ABC-F family ATP-binding cassette domain-containing protei